MGKEIVLPHKMSPWIIENIFRLQRSLLERKSKEGEKPPQNEYHFSQLKQDINTLKKELQLLSANLRSKANK